MLVPLCLLGCVAGATAERVDGTTGPPSIGRQETPDLRAVSLPEVSHLHRAVRRQIGEAYRSLLVVARNPDAGPHARGEAYGELGKLFMAADLLEHAEPCLGNAQVLAPSEFRWPYYLAHVSRRMGNFGRAAERFERALQFRPTDLAATVWLSRMYRELGQPRAAGTLIARMFARLPDVPALRIEAGRNALAVEDYASAVGHLEAALVLDPDAGEVHYPLAMAYRGLGDRERAGRLLRRWRMDGPGAPARLPDPLMAALNGVLRNPQYYRDLASRAASRGAWALAAAHYETAAGAAPEVAMLRLNLGAALERLGDVRGVSMCQVDRNLGTRRPRACC